jgi:SAM-dependent methyltransferase
MPVDETDLYARQARVYDLVHASTKQHGKEVERLMKRVRGAIGRDPLSWLDVGCGTGHHLEILHGLGLPTLAGIDSSATQIAGARERLDGLGITLAEADMRDFEIATPEGGFDVVSCLFSCVGHLHDDADYGQALQSMGACLAKKGVLVLEPWIAREDFRPGRVDVDVTKTDELQIVRVTKHAQDDDFAELEFRFVVSRPESAQIDDWTTSFRLKLRSLAEQQELFEQAFGSVEFHSTGAGSRGLFLARKPRG